MDQRSGPLRFCRGCGKWLGAEAFHVDRRRGDGRFGRCKACRRDDRLRRLRASSQRISVG